VTETDLGAVGPLRPFVCENGTYRSRPASSGPPSALEPRVPAAAVPRGLQQGLPDLHVRRELEGTVILPAIRDRRRAAERRRLRAFFVFPFNAPLTMPDSDSDSSAD